MGRSFNVSSLFAAIVAIAALQLPHVSAQTSSTGDALVKQGIDHVNRGRDAEAIRAFKRYLESGSPDAQKNAQVQTLLRDSEARFQTSWNRHAGFYQSPESRIERRTAQTGFRPEVIFQVTRDWEIGLANQLAPGLAQQGPAVQDPALVGYLDQLVARLVKASPGPDFAYRTSVFNSPVVNATAIPGQISVSSGLLTMVESESELAGIIAHELAHTYAHHAARTVIKQYQAQNLIATLAQAVNPQGAVAQGVTGIISGLGLAIFQRAYSRFEESEADRYSAHLMYNAGYNPTAISQVHLKMYLRNPKQPIKFLSTHPPAPDRVEAITSYLEAFKLDRELALDSATFQKIVKHQTAAATPTAATSMTTQQPAAPSLPPLPPASPPAAIPAAPPNVASIPQVPAPPVQTPTTAAQLPPARTPDASSVPGVGSSAPTAGPAPRAPVPPATPPASPSAPGDLLMGMRGMWATKAGDLTVQFSRINGQLVGFVQRVAGPWAAAQVEPGEQLFKAGRVVGPQSVGGESFSIAPAGCEMSIRYQYGAATLTLDASGVLTMKTSERRGSPPPSCQWTEQIESKTYTFHRAPSR